MNYIQYMKPGGNFGDKLKTGIKKFLKAAGEASRMAKDARINNPGAAMIRDAYAKGDEELAKLLTDEMQAANLTGVALGSGAAPLITGFTVAPVTTGVTLATGMAGGMAGMYGTDKAINYFSDGKYTGWGDWVNQATNGVIGENTAGVFHPGAIFGGAIAGAAGNKIVSTTNRGKLEFLNSELNKLIESSKLNKPFTKLDVLDGYLFHNGHVEVSPAGHNGEKYTYILREAKPGALKIEEGKYKSVRQPYGDNPDLIWWDAEGHNYGKKVYVTKLGNDATHVMSNMEDLPISQVIERYEPSYYVTKLKPVNSVIEYTFDPISGAPIPHMPGKVLNNKMSYEEILTHPVLLQSKSTPTKTSLAFFERQPANISEAERLGIPKGDRGNLSRFQKEALEDLATYRNKWIHQRYPLLDNDGNIIWSNGTNKSFLDTYVAPLRGDQYKGVLLYPRVEDDGSYLMRMSMGSDDLNGGFAGYNGISEITLTSPKMNAINLEISIPIEQASPTLPKDGVKTFWAALQDIALPGSYISGDFGNRPLGYNLIRQYNKIGTPIVSTTNTGVRTITGRNGYLNVINELFRKIPWKSHYDGLSTDSYMALLKLGNRPGYKLRFSKDGFTNWNHQSFENKYILDLYEQALTDPTKLQEFLKVFHDWVAPYGGLDAVIKNGKIIIPQPFIVRQKSGGAIHIKKKNRGSFTRYCNGKVTEECIRKGKNSSNPITRKRANFAWVARHKFKHEEGGTINYLNYFN